MGNDSLIPMLTLRGAAEYVHHAYLYLTTETLWRGFQDDDARAHYSACEDLYQAERAIRAELQR